ncbi:hypothetical protein [Acetobacter vaccinii]|nr:hypothetical protein [Acetobacter vaccinii]
MSHDTARLHRLIPRIALSGAGALGLMTALTGCTNQAYDSFAPACPITHIPPEAADYTLYNGKGTTFRDMVVHASIVRLQGDCLPGGEKNLKTRIVLRLAVERGPAATEEKISLPWFIVVMHGDKIVNKHVFHHSVTFPATFSTFQTGTKVAIVDLPIAPKSVDPGYSFEVGFQLNKDQFDYNRQHMHTATYRAY